MEGVLAERELPPTGTSVAVGSREGDEATNFVGGSRFLVPLLLL